VYVVIVGGGEVGFHIASVLIQEGHEVALIDRDPANHRRASEQLDALVLLGNGASKRVLREANIARASMVIAVTDADEVNMIACMTAKRVGVPLTIARIRSEDYLDDGRAVSTDFTGIDHVIQPEAAVAEEISELIDYPGALDAVTFPGEEVILIETQVAAESPAAGKLLLDIGLPRNVLLTALLREGVMHIPSGKTRLEAGDRVFLVGKRDGVLKAVSMLAVHVRPLRKAILLGVGQLGMRIATMLDARGARLTVFEKDRGRSVEAAGLLHRALVLHDEGLDEDTLRMEGIEETDIFIAATGDDRLNILASLQAKRLGARRTVSIVERAEFSAILEAAGVDVAISPRRITASTILRFVRSGEVLSVALVEKSAGEVLELKVAEGSRLAGRMLREVEFPAGAIVGVLLQADGVHIAHGGSVIHPGDRAIVFALPEAVPAVERIFAR
jgi:trk system potassium uptake protein